MPDYPDFTKPILFKYQETPDLTRAEWAARNYEYKSWYLTVNIVSGESFYHNLYTVPTGKKLMICHYLITTKYYGLQEIYFEGGATIVNATLFRDTVLGQPLAQFITGASGSILKVSGYNEDTIDGKSSYNIISIEEPASVPAKPKSPDPIDRYKAGDFNWAKILILDDKEKVILFGKAKEKNSCVLHIANMYQKNEKKIKSFYTNKEDIEEFSHLYHLNPKNVKEKLKKYKSFKI